MIMTMLGLPDLRCMGLPACLSRVDAPPTYSADAMVVANSIAPVIIACERATPSWRHEMLIMPDRSRRLPSLQTLVVFEVAARQLNFSAAARALGTTQSAVSHRIGALEAELGVPLFRRLRRGVVLTPEGARLFQAVRQGLDTIAGATAELSAAPARRRFDIATDFGFAAFWLMPRLAALSAALDGREVRIVTLQDAIDPADQPFDAAVAFGARRVRGCRVTPLFPEVVVPVASPGFAAGRPPVADPAALLDLPLLHLESANPGRWLTWPDWFRAHGLDPPAGSGRLTFNNYPMVVQAAVAGQGVALGWRPLVDELIGAGQLVVLGRPVSTERGYVLVEPAGRHRGRGATALCDWLRRQAMMPVFGGPPAGAPQNAAGT